MTTLAMTCYALLGGATLLSIAVSLPLHCRLRGLRNLAVPASYVLAFVLIEADGLRAGLVWLAAGACTGILYATYDAWTALRGGEGARGFSAWTILHGFFLWPLMLPEVLEYIWAGLSGDSSRQKPKDQASVLDEPQKKQP